MEQLEGRVAIVTGAGRGLGREHALHLAAHGARVVVNDLGTAPDGTGKDPAPADDVVAEIRAAGGEAVANHDDAACWDGARRLIEAAVDAYGDLDVLVNNAGFLRDSTIVNMTEDDFDAVVRVHLKGHLAPIHWAANLWRERHKAGERKRRNVISTSSTSGIYANPGQANYGPAKSAVITLSEVAAKELAAYGVTVNCVVPGARTRLTMSSPGLPEIMGQPAQGFDQWDPANVSPLVAYLAAADCPFTGTTFFVQGGTIRRLETWTVVGDTLERASRWQLDDLRTAMEAFRANG